MLILEPHMIMALLVIVGLIVGVAYFVFYVRRSHAPGYILENPRVISELLEMALDSRSKFTLQFMDTALEGRGFSGLCVQISAQSVLIDVSLDYMVPAWQGRDLAVYFHVKQNRTTSYYQFVSKIRAVRPYRSLYAFELEFPQCLNPTQKRRAVRTSIPQSMINAIGAWAKPIPEKNPAKLGKSLWRYRPGFPSTIMLDDLSASGIRIEADYEATLLEHPGLQKGQSLVLLLLLYSPEENRINNYWFFGEIRHMHHASDRKKLIYGIEFVRWANAADIRDEIQWMPVGKDGEVPPLVSWVLRRELENTLRIGKH